MFCFVVIQYLFFITIRNQASAIDGILLLSLDKHQNLYRYNKRNAIKDLFQLCTKFGDKLIVIV